ncbi:phosphoribosylglycinamide formyltransferase [Flavobacteriaceae bacterium]|jgi:phosphoribosylglycinamide formyltransferase-1|nr:phosphoribosylglycinamide formyltransferase [Flavobacteriaceae bacterium]
MQKKIIILASGNGSNAEKIIDFFESSSAVKVLSVISNKQGAGVFDRAKKFGVPAVLFKKKSFETNEVLSYLEELKPDLIVLAGFLLKIPKEFVLKFPNKIINIHPALLPKYGGKGMYGSNVHKAVKESGDLKTGITIHYVNENYDEGAIIFQAEVGLDASDSPETIATKVHALEHQHFPQVINQILRK